MRWKAMSVISLILIAMDLQVLRRGIVEGTKCLLLQTTLNLIAMSIKSTFEKENWGGEPDQKI